VVEYLKLETGLLVLSASIALLLTLDLLLFPETPGIWGEDSAVESLQALVYVLAGSVQLMIVMRPSEVRSTRRFFHVLLSVLFFVVALEEISWGQRFIGWETPDFLRELNLQGETNIHNIHGSVFNLFVTLFVFIYCYLIPLSSHLSSRVRGLVGSIGLPVVSIDLVSVFIIADLFRPLDLGQLDSQLALLASILPLALYLSRAVPGLFRGVAAPRIQVLLILLVGMLALLLSALGSDVPSLWVWESRELLFGVGFLSFSVADYAKGR
jgi:hypothetical protein